MQKKIKILHIQETIGSGGVERRRLSLAKHLDRNLFDQLFVCTVEKGNIPGEIRSLGFDVISIGKLKSPFDWSQHKKIQKIINDYKPDIIHGAVFEGVTMAAVNGWIKKVPVVIVEETSDPQNRSWKGNLLMKALSFLADKFVGVSQGVTDEYLKAKLKISDKKVILVNNGVAIPRDVSTTEISEAKMKWGIKENDFVIGSTGRMLSDSHKRFSDLIKAFANFSKKNDHAKLILIGEGPERAGYEKLAQDLQMSDKVIFTGYQSDVALFYRMMDVFAMVSAREAFGLVLAEAMLNKLPVIATRVGGMKYIVEDHHTGFLVEPFKIDEMSEKFENLFNNSQNRTKMGENGFEIAMTQYTEAVYVKKIETLYLDAFKQKK